MANPLVRWEVTLQQKIRIPFRKSDEIVERLFTVNARTRRQAMKAVTDAGHKGNVVDAKKVSTPKRTSISSRSPSQRDFDRA